MELFGKRVHSAIMKQKMDWLQFMVDRQKAPLEERNYLGMTPLYLAVHSSWPDGALFLLERGAEVINAERGTQTFCHFHKPLISLALQKRSQPLLRELIKRGAKLGHAPCLDQLYEELDPFSGENATFDCLADAVSERGNLLKDLLFVISTGTKYGVGHEEVGEFIRKQQSCHQAKMYQVFAACCSSGSIPDYNLALRYWRVSAEGVRCHDHTVVEAAAPRSVFADILDAKEHPLPDTVTTDDEKLAIHVHALFALEKYIPEDSLLLEACRHVHSFLFLKEKQTTAVGVLQRCTTIRALYSCELRMLLQDLKRILGDLGDAPELCVAAFLEFIQTIENCVSSLTVACSEADHATFPMCRRDGDAIFRRFFKLMINAMVSFYGRQVSATPEQFQSFSSHIKNIVRTSPWTHCPNIFQCLALEDWYCPSSPSMVKMLLAFSAEVFSTVHQANSPPHLLSGVKGNTPLHDMARFWSRQDLVQEGVLQCFLDHGAHLCTRNDEGETARSILVRRGVCSEGELLPSLQCLAAAAFMRDERLRQNVQHCGPAKVRDFLMDH